MTMVYEFKMTSRERQELDDSLRESRFHIDEYLKEGSRPGEIQNFLKMRKERILNLEEKLDSLEGKVEEKLPPLAFQKLTGMFEYNEETNKFDWFAF